MTSLLRPVAFTASRNDASSQASIVYLSMGSAPGTAAASDGRIGVLIPISTATVLRTTGMSNPTAAVARVRACSSTTLRSCSQTSAITLSW
jgi:hypothetical protein